MAGVIGFEVYRRDIVIKYARYNRSQPRSTRGEIMKFSGASRKRLAFYAANTDIEFTWMITLTYPGEWTRDGKEVKKSFNRFLSWARSTVKDGRLSYLWFLEFQARGAPHFHILLSRPLDRDSVSKRWFMAVGSGDERHLFAGTRVEKIRKRDGAARYAVKYAQKMRQKEVPEEYRDIGRFWGCSKDVKPVPVGGKEYQRVVKKDELVQAMGLFDLMEIMEERPISTIWGGREKEGLVDEMDRLG
jgi:hypothetical protein